MSIKVQGWEAAVAPEGRRSGPAPEEPQGEPAAEAREAGPAAGLTGRYRADRDLSPLPGRGHRQLSALVAVAGLLLVLLGGGVALAASQPLTATDGVLASEGASAAIDLAQDRPVRQLQYRDRTPLTYSMTLRNSGLVPVTLAGATLPPSGSRLLLRLEAVQVLPEGSTDLAAGVPLDGQRLWPGQERTLVLQARFTDCERIGARSSSLLTSVELEIAVAGMPRHQSVRLPELLRAGSPREAGCPRATAGSRPPG